MPAAKRTLNIQRRARGERVTAQRTSPAHAAQLAALRTRCAASSGPIIVTQKGYPTGVLLSIADYSTLIAGAERSGALAAEPVAEEAAPALVVEEIAVPAPAPAPGKGMPRKKV